MKKIEIKVGSKAEKILNELLERKKAIKEGLMERLPPKEVRDFIREKTKQTAELNKHNDTFDRASYRLGMYSMWDYMYHNKMIAPQIKKEE